MSLSLVALLVATLAAWPAVRRLGSRGFLVPAAGSTIAFTGLAAAAPRVLAGDVPVIDLPWIPQLGVSLAFRLDPLSWLVALVVTGVGAAVLGYCVTYFGDDEPALPRFATLLTAFALVMLLLVTADDIVVMFVMWEATSVLSYLLIGHTADRRESRGAALQALLVTTLGGLVMLVGVVMLVVDAGTTSLAGIVAAAAPGTGTTVAVLLVLVGAISKSAIVPFHFWLPSAMAAPTPVSAYLHSAAMVKAGVYLVLRLAPGFATTPGWHQTLLTLGCATLLVGAWRALRQFDLKLLLAYGTVSQLGLLMVVASVGTRESTLAALTLLVAHALFKSTLFMVVGVIDHSCGTRDWRALSGIGRRSPLLATVGVLAAASMAGLPPLLGFVAKETALTAIIDAAAPGGVTGAVVLVAVAAGSALTVAYAARFVWGAFATRSITHTPQHRLVDCERPHDRGLAGLTAPVVLVAVSLGLALWPAPLDVAASAAAAGLPDSGHDLHLALWHGFTPALGVTALVLAAGLALFALRRPVARLQARLPEWVDLADGYTAALSWTDRVAVRVTLLAQRGGLPGYVGTILVVFAAGLGGVLAAGGWTPPALVGARSLAEAGVVVLAAVAAVAAAAARRRLLAVLLAGVTGYGMVALFALAGAPDLALTQLLVETVSLVVFVLVLRRLPRHFEADEPRSRRWPRAVIGVAVGMVMAGLALAVTGARQATPVSVDLPDLAYLEAHGRNVVNVLLVDIRAWDTLGEISVLVAVATGVASLVFVTGRAGRVPTIGGRRRGADHRRAAAIEPVTGAIPTVDPETGRPLTQTRMLRTIDDADAVDDDRTRRSWLLAGRTLASTHRSLLVEVVVRLTFLPFMLIAVMLLIAGHNQPGGGFIAGLVAGLALVLRYLAAGRYELGEALPVPPGLLLGGGLALALGTGAVSLLFGEPFLTSLWWEGHVQLLGEIALGTPTLFDIGVCLVVVGLVLDVLRSLGAGLDEQAVDDPELVDAWTEGAR